MNWNISFFLLCVSVCLIPVSVQAQRENVWAFGDHAGLDFNGRSPVAIKTSIVTREGCASISDEKGRLLFYTDGTSVWDRNNVLMPNGKDLPGFGVNITSSTVQGSMIMPMPGSSTKYYVFSLGAIELGHFGELYYSIVDMELNNGLGDLSMMGKLLENGLAEHMTGVAGNNCDIWLLTISSTTGSLNAYKIEASGIHTNPVLSPTIGSIEKYGTIDVSPDRKRLAIAKNDLLLMNFDAETGTATNPVLLNTPNGYYGTCFSPDGSKLYSSSGSVLQQFDLSSRDVQKIKASRMTISSQAFSMKRGPDNKIYVTTGLNGTSPALNVINYPNLAGMDCQLMRPGIQLLPGTAHNLGLPNVVPMITNRRVYHTTTDSIFCPQPVLLTASNPYGKNYIWEDSSTGITRQVDGAGVYWLSYQVSSDCILDDEHVDTFNIVYPVKDYEVSFSADNLICIDHVVRFENTSDPHYNNFKWSFGNQDSAMLVNPSYTYTKAGTYEVMLIGKIDDICPDTAYQIITVDPVIPTAFVTSRDSICKGESIAFSQDMMSPTIVDLQWQFGDGAEMIFLNEREVRHAYEGAGIFRVTLNSNFRACPDTSFTSPVYVFDLPEVTLGADQKICPGDPPIILKNLSTTPTSIYYYKWNTGDTAENIKVMQPGIYNLTISAGPLGCSNTASVQIAKDCFMDIPNAFTPNGDGINDYFFPRQLLSKHLSRFKMQVFNQWGQLVFQTTQIYGRGWDGKFNDREQPLGVYLYSIEVAIDDGKPEEYRGNVTLIR